MILYRDHEVGQLHIHVGTMPGCGQADSIFSGIYGGQGRGLWRAPRVLSSPEAPQRGCSCPQVPAACSGESVQLPKPLTSGQRRERNWLTSEYGEAVQNPWERNRFLNSLALKTPSATCSGKVRAGWMQFRVAARSLRVWGSVLTWSLSPSSEELLPGQPLSLIQTHMLMRAHTLVIWD